MLMELFAIAASLTDRGLTYRNRSIVESYIRTSSMMQDKAGNLLHYAHFLKKYQDNPPSGIVQLIEQACTLSASVIGELTQIDRLNVILHLLDISLSDHTVTNHEIALINAVAQEFKIPTLEMEGFRKIVLEQPATLAREDNFVIIQDQIENGNDELEGSWIERNKPRESQINQVIHRTGLKGTLVFFYVESVNAFVVRYSGESELYNGTRELIRGRLTLFGIEDKISGKRILPVSFNEALSFLQPAEARSRIVLQCRKLAYDWKNSYFQIKPFSVVTESGNLVAIIGEKNSGKSTILRILSGELRNYRGSVRINGYELRQEWYKLRNIIGHVPEQDIIINELSVYDNLYYNARLCFSNSGEEEIRKRINKLMEFLDIRDIRNLLPGRSKLSAFERKKINIGLELLKDPQVLLLDEPMTGLSSSESESLSKLLKSLSVSGKLVIASMHHASSRAFKIFQQVWILDDEGYIIYTGATEDAIDHFTAEGDISLPAGTDCKECSIYDPERIFETIRSRKINEKGHFITERKKSPLEWHNLYKEKIEKKTEYREARKILPQVLFIHPNLGIQNIMYAMRYIKIWMNCKLKLLLNLFIPAAIIGILAYILRYNPETTYTFAQNSNIYLYFSLSVIATVAFGMVLSAEEFVRYRHRLIREEVITLTRIGCINVRVFILLIIAAVQSFLVAITGNHILQIKGMTLLTWLVLFSSTSFGVLLGLFLSSIFRSRLSIYILIAVLIIPQILFDGVAIDFNKLPSGLRNERFVPVIADLMVSRWGYEALMVNQFKNNPYEQNYYTIDRKLNQKEIYADIIIPALQAKVLDCIGKKESGRSPDSLASELNLVSNEFNQLAVKNDIFPFEFQSKLNSTEFARPVAEEAMNYLAFVRNSFYENVESLKQSRDSVEKALDSKYGRNGLDMLKNAYNNEFIANLVKNQESQEVIRETETRFIPLKFPIYLSSDSSFGRAPFYAAYKLLNGQYINTEWFNILIIWLLSFVLYVILISELGETVYNRISLMIPRKSWLPQYP